MGSIAGQQRPIRIGGASGGFTDRVSAISRLAQLSGEERVDGIVGDWLSENVMTGYGAGRRKALAAKNGARLSLEERLKTPNFASTFLQCFTPAISSMYSNKIKLVVNAGASDTELLAEVVDKQCRDAGCEMKVAWVEGDDVTDTFVDMAKKGAKFISITDGKTLEEWGFEPICAQAYLGSLGIAEALRKGADIVICGRVSDAAPTIGLAAWWHGWNSSQFDELARALIAGHLIECSAFVCGGYYSAFKDLMKARKHLNIGFPVAEIDHTGEIVITKEPNTGGIVNTETIISQLVYEISGPLYYNSDSVANLANISAKDIGIDRVLVSGITGLPPPPTTRVGVTAHGGYQAEWHFYLVGLDMEEKVQWMEEQARYAIGEELMSQFSCLKFQLHGTSPINAETQESATVDFRIFAQARDKELFDPGLTDGFSRRLYETVLQSCPGVSRSNDLRQSTAKSYYEYFVTLIPQSACNHRVHLLYEPHSSTPISLPPKTQTYGLQDSYNTPNPLPLDTWGETEEAPMGYVVLGRSGDKASDANVGFFVRRDDEWDWLRSLLTIEKVQEMVGGEKWKGNRIDRFEMKNLRAVHFLLKDHLDRGYNSGSGMDTLAKNLCEYLRSKFVPIPKKFLERGRV